MFSTILNNATKLAESNKKPSDLLVEFIYNIYENTNFIGIKINGETYKELPNNWETRKNFNETEKKSKCNGYYQNECKLKRQKLKKKDTYEFIIDYGPYTKKHLDFKLFNRNAVLHIKNKAGYNMDHRGSDHFAYKLPFETHIRLINPTLKDLIDGLYLIKSHKCDKWYELYSGAKFLHKTFTYNDKCVFEVDFDHGS